MVLRVLPPSRFTVRLSLQLLLLVSAIITLSGIEALWRRTTSKAPKKLSPTLSLPDLDLNLVRGKPAGAYTTRPPCVDKPFVDTSPRSDARGQIALVTGVAGFIGAQVAEHCLRLGLRVIGVDDLSSGYLSNVPTEVNFVLGSVGDPRLLDKLFRRYRFDYVYHLAGHGSVRLSHHQRSFVYTNEVVASAHLLNAVVRAGDTKCLVYLSSAAVYGQPAGRYGDVPFKETDPTHPDTPYGIAKLAVEQDIRATSKRFGLNFVILRAHSVFGPGVNIRDPHHGIVGAYLMAHLTRNTASRQPLVVFGDGSQKRSFTYVKDLAEVVSIAPFVPLAWNNVYNVGTDEKSSINDLIEAIQSAMGSVLPTQRVPADGGSLLVDHTKFRCIFGSQSWTSLQDGLQETVQWVMHLFSGLSKAEIADVLKRRCLDNTEVKQGIGRLGDLCARGVNEVLEVRTLAPSDHAREALKRWPGRLAKF